MGFELHDYSGTPDAEVWGKEVGETFAANDRTAKKVGLWWGKEKIIINGEDIGEDWTFIKYKLVDQYGNFQGIGLMAIPDFEKENVGLEIMNKYNLI